MYITGAEVVTVPVADAEYVEFSPLGTYLVTWSRPHKGSATATGAESGNMKVWEASTATLVTSFSQKIYKTQVRNKSHLLRIRCNYLSPVICMQCAHILHIFTCCIYGR